MEYDNGSRSVHAFIDQKTGDVFKPASFKAPAKIARYNVLRIESREEMLERADWKRWLPLHPVIKLSTSGALRPLTPAILSSTNKHTMDRTELQQKYIQWDLEQMTADDLVQFFIDTQMRELGDLDDDELMEDVKQFAPELL